MDSDLLASDEWSADADSEDYPLYHRRSYHRQTSSRVDSEERNNWIPTDISDSKHKQKPKQHVNRKNRPRWHLFHHLYSLRQHHELSQQRHNFRDEQEMQELCAAFNIRGTQETQRPSYDNARTSHRDSHGKQQCFINNAADVQRLLPDRFMSQDDLNEILPLLTRNVATVHTKDKQHHDNIMFADHSKMVALPHTQPSMKRENQESFGCGACFT
ncbi:hypothetical protein PoB_005237800 [Plakobranchus ocellatus]|uniref:Uncharacterized protein n=1 Tax=Plakobranchus ocellatus TaxID=259542 RepID=A0AAV4C4F7_9GAST|nr:hypothetical protein PoB_005237800 [Plakobranchus ocellatus]